MITISKNKLTSICFKIERTYHLHRVCQVQGKTKWDIHYFSTRDVNKDKRNKMRYVRSKDKHTNIKYRYFTSTIIITNLYNIMIGIIIRINLEN
jgi:hypothetical protein